MFDMAKAARILNKRGKYHLKKYEQYEDQESWVAIRPVILFGKRETVYINITVIYSENLMVFVTPLHGEGREGLVGKGVEVLDGILHYFNSRSKGGFLTKYTYDNSNAIVFMLHLPLSRMDLEWFEATLDYCTDAVMVFRPLVDNIIHSLHLKFDNEAGIFDSARRYLEKHARQFLDILPAH